MTTSDAAAATAPPAEPAGTDLLSRAPAEGARLLALSFLDQAAAARPRLDDPDDAEALHDFRVALRRLRSCLKAYRAHLEDSVPRKLAKKLRRLADATGSGRDAEVQIEWLRQRASHLSAYHRAGLAWLLDRLEARKREAYDAIRAEVAEEFAEVERELRRRLSVYRAEVRLDGAEKRETLGGTTAAILREMGGELAAHLARLDGAGDEREVHRARIRAKRLRYLVEPLADEVADARPLVKRIKNLQDLLGELHDAHVLEHELARAVEAAAAERAAKLFAVSLDAVRDEKLLRAERRRARESGLLALARQNRDRRDRLYETLAEEWLDGRGGDLLREVERLETALAPPAP
ncbi:MAG TPA: CHAD domain-containing protein [Thermoanaerobaculia bacterium]|nr:CHAD domain-containing protein [Thermoanaerobaculia bacterium]